MFGVGYTKEDRDVEGKTKLCRDDRGLAEQSRAHRQVLS